MDYGKVARECIAYCAQAALLCDIVQNKTRKSKGGWCKTMEAICDVVHTRYSPGSNSFLPDFYTPPTNFQDTSCTDSVGLTK